MNLLKGLLITLIVQQCRVVVIKFAEDRAEKQKKGICTDLFDSFMFKIISSF